jgi:serine/threonine-protein kinase HipA
MGNDGLEVFVAGMHVGSLRQSADGLFVFSYNEYYSGPDLSVKMPVSGEAFDGRVVNAWFDNLLPDDPQVRQGMANASGLSAGTFALLSRFGLDLPGAVQIVPTDSVDAIYNQTQGYVRISSNDIANRLRLAIEAENKNKARSWAGREEHWSLGGMQTKLSLREYKGEWFECRGSSASNVILKPGAWGLSNQALVECITSRLAGACGLPVAGTRIETFDDMDVLVVGRYDRFTDQASGFVTRVHQEDMCQATATMSDYKYAVDGGPTTPDILMVLESAEGDSKSRFIDAVIFNYLTASTDAHAKNYSLLHPQGSRFVLAPLYDLASAAPYLKPNKTYRTAMSIGGENRIGWLRKSCIERFARTACIRYEDVACRVETIADAIESNLESVIETLSDKSGIDEVGSLMLTRINALCDTTCHNIRIDGRNFKPIDIAKAK